jgi:uncharacterized protein YndB with AHSA1/START domain
VIQESDKNKVVIRWDLRASPEELFDAWTDAEGMRTWICPGNILSVVGGNLLVIKRDTDKVYEHRGELLILERPARLPFTWVAAATDHQQTVVTVEFFSIDGWRRYWC